MEKENIYYATGRRKSSVARTWLKPGNGNIIINNRPGENYFRIQNIYKSMLQPLALTNTMGDFDVKVTVKGGGYSGQAGAVRHGITRALMLVNPELRTQLKRAGFVRRDPRTKERKKYGQRGARARYQFSKR
ncbi:MAG: 30S ribosomal protein S9 [Desulfobacterales bacterium]